MFLAGPWAALMVVNFYLFIYFIFSVVLYSKVLMCICVSSPTIQSRSPLSSQGRQRQRTARLCDWRNLVRPINVYTERTEWKAILCLQPKRLLHIYDTEPSISQEFVKSNLPQLELNVSPLTIWWRPDPNVNFWVPLGLVFFAEVMREAISRDPRYVCELWQDVN